MGAWGTESCSNDSCWDCLYAKNIHQMTQKEADNSLARTFEELSFFGDDAANKESALGVVIWILRQGLVVNKKYLKRALKWASDLSASKDYMNEWDSPQERKMNLDKESVEINKALIAKGKGIKQHIPGLLEKIAEKINVL